MFKPCAVVDVDRCMCMDGWIHTRALGYLANGYWS